MFKVLSVPKLITKPVSVSISDTHQTPVVSLSLDMTVYMERPSRRVESVLRWEHFYYDCRTAKTNKVGLGLTATTSKYFPIVQALACCTTTHRAELHIITISILIMRH